MMLMLFFGLLVEMSNKYKIVGEGGGSGGGGIILLASIYIDILLNDEGAY